jgi:hypothetical protein
LDESRTEDNTQVRNEENAFLSAPFTQEEVSKSFPNGTQLSSSPDGFPAELYQNFLDVTKKNLMKLFGALHTRKLEVFK